MKNRKILTTILACLIVICIPFSAFAAEYQSKQSGISFDVPSGYAAISTINEKNADSQEFKNDKFEGSTIRFSSQPISNVLSGKEKPSLAHLHDAVSKSEKNYDSIEYANVDNIDYIKVTTKGKKEDGSDAKIKYYAMSDKNVFSFEANAKPAVDDVVLSMNTLKSDDYLYTKDGLSKEKHVPSGNANVDGKKEKKSLKSIFSNMDKKKLIIIVAVVAGLLLLLIIILILSKLGKKPVEPEEPQEPEAPQVPGIEEYYAQYVLDPSSIDPAILQMLIHDFISRSTQFYVHTKGDYAIEICKNPRIFNGLLIIDSVSGEVKLFDVLEAKRKKMELVMLPTDLVYYCNSSIDYLKPETV